MRYCEILTILVVMSLSNTGCSTSLSFNGANQYVQIADDQTLHPEAGLTLEAWVKLSNRTGGAIVAKPYGNAKNDSFALDYNGGILDAVVNTEGNERATYAWSPTLDQWYHVAMTFDDSSDTLRLYIDGAQVSSAVTSRSLAYDAHPIYFGIDIDDGSYVLPFHGQIDNVRIWNYARSEAEISGSFKKILPSGTLGLLGQWAFSEGQGESTFDSSGHGHVGTLGSGSNRPAWVVDNAPKD